ncbi:MAG: HD domain-containing protein, partial [Coriobacteriia bacterium]|nr:HD domain-containing protein [Coriobacteriia bacterium]
TPDPDGLRNSMSEWVTREGRPLIFNPTSGAGGFAKVDAVSGALAALCVPLMTAEGAVGAIIVGSRSPDFRFNSDDVRLLSTIANHVTIAIGNIELFSSLQEAYFSTVRSLAAAVDAKDPFTRGHSDRVAMYATMMGQRLGLSMEQCTALEMAAYLHDIGKIGVREEILLKPGRLDDAEMSQMRHHPLIGANILKPVGFPWPITPVVRHHHERWDGDGYPAGLKGEEIPLLARVLTVADAFEAMTADRPYRSGRSISQGIEELRRCSGSQFDTRIVEAFIEALEASDILAKGIEVPVLEEVQSDEARAIFVAVIEGMLSSFRRLGGPRLAANVEQELNDLFADRGYPITVSSGRVSVHFEDGISDELRSMRDAVKLVDETMGRMSGETLVDHFYADAMATLSDRMRLLAHSLDFHG